MRDRQRERDREGGRERETDIETMTALEIERGWRRDEKRLIVRVGDRERGEERASETEEVRNRVLE